MSTLQVTTIQSNTANTAPLIKDSAGTEIGQLAKAWVTYNQSTQAILGSFNVSSVTYTSAGKCVVNLAIPVTDANFAFSGTASKASNAYIVNIDTGATISANSIPIAVSLYSNTLTDNARISVIIYR